MVSANGHSLNGHHVNGSNGHTLHCESDHGDVIDMVPFIPSAPRPGWKDAFPAYTHNLSWCDSDGNAHSMTLRSDDLQSLLADLKLLKNMIRQSKQQHSNVQSQTSESQPQAQAEPDSQHCSIHGVDMPRRWSKRTNGNYFGHKLPDGGFCYGKVKA